MKNEKVLDFVKPELLESNGFKFNDVVVRYFSDKQILNLKAKLVEKIFELDKKNRFIAFVKSVMTVDIDLETIAEKITEAMTDLPDTDVGIKSLNKQIANLKEKIKNRYEENEEMVYKMSYFDIEKVAIYDIDGNLVSSRPMHKHEKQTSIFDINSKEQDG